jgi:hypothetical protein
MKDYEDDESDVYDLLALIAFGLFVLSEVFVVVFFVLNGV